MTDRERALLGRAGYGRHPEEWQGVIQGPAGIHGNTRLHYDASLTVQNRRMMNAAAYIEEHFDELVTGAVIDVRVLLAEATEAVVSEYA
jgi:hypothetical protein